MFLQYFIWGAWYVTAATYMSKILNSSGAEIGNTYSAFAFAAIISPFLLELLQIDIFLHKKQWERYI